MKKCESCGKEFTPQESHHRTCPDCFRVGRGGGGGGGRGPGGGGSRGPHAGGGGGGGGGPRPELLKAYYDDKGNLLPGVYVDIPQRWAERFQSGDVKTAAIRRFYTQLRRIYDDQRRSGKEFFGEARSQLFSLLPKVNYKTEAKVVNDDFRAFINHHANLASESPENLRGFKEHFEAVVCYLKK